MKNNFRKIFALITLITLVSACSNDYETSDVTGNGSLVVEFDNAFGDNNLILNSQPNTTSNDEVLKITAIKYIVSNIVLTNENGTTFTYPKNESYFIVDESNESSLFLDLKNIPAGDYTKVKFGIGVDEAQWALGAEGQGNFYAEAQAADLMWSWTAGYKFVAFEGTFTCPKMPEQAAFMVHTGKTGATYNYTEVTLNLPTKALVRTNIKPQIHIVADVSKIIDGKNKIVLMDSNKMGMGAMIMGGANLPLITENLSDMFSVNHVHND